MFTISLQAFSLSIISGSTLVRKWSRATMWQNLSCWVSQAILQREKHCLSFFTHLHCNNGGQPAHCGDSDCQPLIELLNVFLPSMFVSHGCYLFHCLLTQVAYGLDLQQKNNFSLSLHRSSLCRALIWWWWGFPSGFHGLWPLCSHL